MKEKKKHRYHGIMSELDEVDWIAAREKWEQLTIHSPQVRVLSSGKKLKENFRIYGSAAAVLDWNEPFCDIVRVESLAPKQGAATKMLKFLIELSREYGVVLRGSPVPYPPTFSEAAKSPMTQKRLIEWYQGLGFEVWESRGYLFMGFPSRAATSL